MVEGPQEALPIVLITGITGYIGSHVGKQLLDRYSDRFRIRATVRSLTNTAKLDPLKRAFGEDKFNQIEFVEADLNDSESLIRAIQGVQYVIHLANPLPGTKKQTEDSMVKPATEGMWAILDAAVLNKVRRLVVTSSMATITGSTLWKRPTGDHHYSEQDYAPYDGQTNYYKSKIAQEGVIRFFIERQEKVQPDHKVEVVTLHPTAVFGPTLINDCSGSIEGIVKIIRRQVPGLPEMWLPSVDVRDVAEAHVKALITDGLHGQRILVNKGSFQMVEDIAQTLRKEFEQYGYRPQTRRISSWILKLGQCFDDQVQIVLPMIGIHLTADNKLSKQLLGITYDNYEFKQTIIDMGYSLIEMGLIPNKMKK